MRVFTLICSMLLIATGGAGYYGWGHEGGGPETLISAIPAFFGAAMLLAAFIALLLRRTGLQLAFILAIAGGFSGLGRLTPSYLKETLDWKSYPINLIVAMAGICLFYVIVAGFCYLFVRKKPVRSQVKEEGALKVLESDEAEGQSDASGTEPQQAQSA
ncbi:MAG: hypothetical protein KA152_14035 [Verrucomicrobiales bacterium]|nr:hypothetical protein [Verrucomicrobiales bacterium]